MEASPANVRFAAARSWVGLVLLLAALLPPLMVSLDARLPDRIMENLALVSSMETALRLAGDGQAEADPHAWLIPTINGIPRLRKPPMLVWLNLAAWTGLDPATAPMEQLVWRARMVAVAAGLLLAVGTWWIGRSLDSPRLGLIAAAVTCTSWFYFRQARTASYDIVYVALATLSVAAGLWAMRRGAVAAAAGVLLAGIALAASILTKGPLACLVALIPMLAAVWYGPGALPESQGRGMERGRRFALVAAIFAVAAVFAAPWYLWALRTYPATANALTTEYRAARDVFQPPWYYVGLFALVLPWTIWLIAGLCHPFRFAGDERRRRMIAWMAFVVALIGFSIPGAKSQRYILPLIPYVGLLAAWVLIDHRDASARGKPERGAAPLIHLHWIGLCVASIGLPLMLQWPDRLFEEPTFLRISWGVAFAAMAAMIGLAALGYRAHLKQRLSVAMAAAVLWCSAAGTLVYHAYDAMPRSSIVFYESAQELDALIGSQRVVYLASEHADHAAWREAETWLFYFRRIVPWVEPGALSALRREAPATRVLARETTRSAALMQQAGYVQHGRFPTDPESTWHLWVAPGQ